MANIVRESIGDESNGGTDDGALAIKVTAEVSEALTGFKALQRELRETTKELRKLEQAHKDVEASLNGAEYFPMLITTTECNVCSGAGFVGIGDGVRGIKKCEACRCSDVRLGRKPEDVEKSITDDITRSYE